MKVNSLREFHMRRAHVRLLKTTTMGEIVRNLLDFFDIVLAACFIESFASLVVFNGRFAKSILWDREKEPRGKLFLKHLTQFSPQQKLEKKIEFEFQQFCCY